MKKHVLKAKIYQNTISSRTVTCCSSFLQTFLLQILLYIKRCIDMHRYCIAPGHWALKEHCAKYLSQRAVACSGCCCLNTLRKRYIAIVSAFLTRAMRVGRLSKMVDTENKKKEKKKQTHKQKWVYSCNSLTKFASSSGLWQTKICISNFQVRFGVNKHKWNFLKATKIHEPVGYRCPRQRRAFFQLGLDCKWPWFRASSTLTRGIFQLDNNFQKGLRLHFPHGTYVCLSSVKWPAKIVNYAAGRKGLCYGLFHIVEELDIST